MFTWRSGVDAVRARLNILGLNQHEIVGIEDASNPERETADTVVRAPITSSIALAMSGLEAK